MDEVKSSIEQNGWLLLILDSVGCNVSRVHHTQAGATNTTWATFKAPTGFEIRVAVPLNPGVGTVPEGYIQLCQFEELVTNLNQAVEAGMSPVLENPTEETSNKTQQGDW